MTEILDVFKLLLKKRFGFKFVYSSSYWMLNAGKHIFPIVKYRMLYERLLELGARKDGFLVPEPASDEDVLRVHTAKYLRKLKTGALSALEIQALEIPFSPELVKFALLSTGGTILTAERGPQGRDRRPLGGGLPSRLCRPRRGFLRPERYRRGRRQSSSRTAASAGR